jgi:Tfp pilus assembly protein PilV
VLKLKTQTNIKKKSKRRGMEKGTTLVETLISMAILSYVIVTILSGFSQKQLSTQNTGDKNAAVFLAETKVEELLKFPANQLATENLTDYIVFRGEGFKVYKPTDTIPNEVRQFKRTWAVTRDLLGQMATIRVQVDYGANYITQADRNSGTLIYPFSIVLSTRRAVQ